MDAQAPAAPMAGVSAKCAQVVAAHCATRDCEAGRKRVDPEITLWTPKLTPCNPR